MATGCGSLSGFGKDEDAEVPGRAWGVGIGWRCVGEFVVDGYLVWRGHGLCKIELSMRDSSCLPLRSLLGASDPKSN